LATVTAAAATAAAVSFSALPTHAREALSKGPGTKPKTPPATSAPRAYVEQNGRRIVAVGDLHGDLMPALKALQLAGLVDETGGKWIGGTTILVQVGDILDRGDHELSIMRLFRRLEKQAAKAGGAVHTINGNHEIMNVAGDFRYVTPGGMKQFANMFEQRNGAAPGAAQSPRGAAAARREMLKPGSEVAMQLAKNPTVLQVGDTLFAHAGVLPEHVSYGFDKLNEQVAGWMEGRYPAPPRPVIDDNGVVWNRTYGGGPESMYGPQGACPLLNKVLEDTHAKRMVIGHTPQEAGANAECRGKLWRIDVGQSRGILGAAPQVIEIVGDSVKVLQARR